MGSSAMAPTCGHRSTRCCARPCMAPAWATAWSPATGISGWPTPNAQSRRRCAWRRPATRCAGAPSAPSAATRTASAICSLPVRPADSVDRVRSRRLLNGRREHLADVDGIEAIHRAAEVAADLGLAAFGHQRVDLVAAEAAQHAGHALSRTGAGELRLLRLEQPHGLLPEKPAQDLLGQQVQQLAGLQRAGQRRDAVEVLAESDAVLVALLPAAA